MSALGHATLLTVYGRGFGMAPALGRLGQASGPDDLARRVRSERAAIAVVTHRPVRLAIHLIYGMAVPCTDNPRCVTYLDDQGADLVSQYILPAAQRGWLVVLDDQLGRSNPLTEVQRLIDRGYLGFDNVEIAFDPEFRTAVNQDSPGIPTGYVTARELNAAQAAVDRYARRLHLAHRKLMLIHEWLPGMIRGRSHLQQGFLYVQPAIIMDAIGAPANKQGVYQSLLRHIRPGILPGIKLFPSSPYDPPSDWDSPVLTWRQLVGGAAGLAGALAPLPRIIVLT